MFMKALIEELIYAFAQKRDWTVVLGAGGCSGSYWIKDGRYRMVSIEPKNYGWLIGINNRLFVDIDDETTCYLRVPNGVHRFDKHKLTKNFWTVSSSDSIISFLQQ